MISAKPTKNLTGVSIEGEFLDFYELVDGIYRMTGLEDSYCDPYYTVKNRLLGLCYDIRHAYMGDRDMFEVDNGVNVEIKKYHKKIFADKNVHCSANILFPEAIFIALSVPYLYRTERWHYHNQRGEESHEWNKFTHFELDKAMLDMLRASILQALGDLIGDEVLEKIVTRRSVLEDYSFYCMQYIEKCDIEYMKCPVEKRVDKLRNITRRIAKRPTAYYRMQEDIEMTAREIGCSVYDIEDTRIEWPEEIEW